MTIHREGWSILIVLVVVLLGLNYALVYFYHEAAILHDVAFGVSILFFLLILQFFRNPIFDIKKNEAQVLAPADGKVVVIEDTDETEYFKAKKKQISIFMSPVNVHVNRMPVGGKIAYYKYHPGKYLVAWHPKSSTENERTTVVTKTMTGKEILFRQIAGALARRIKCYVNVGQELEQGQEFGFIKFGSRVDVFLPTNAIVKVKVGDVAKGGRTVLAELK